jgi:hypothetical protein
MLHITLLCAFALCAGMIDAFLGAATVSSIPQGVLRPFVLILKLACDMVKPAQGLGGHRQLRNGLRAELAEGDSCSSRNLASKSSFMV